MKEPALPESLRETFDQLGGGTAVAGRTSAFRKANARLWEDHSVLMEKYLGQWVAVGADGLIDHSESAEDLVEVVEGRGFDASGYVLQFLDPDPPSLIL